MVSGPGNHERKMSGNIFIALEYLCLEFIDFFGLMSLELFLDNLIVGHVKRTTFYLYFDYQNQAYQLS